MLVKVLNILAALIQVKYSLDVDFRVHSGAGLQTITSASSIPND